MVMKFPIQKKMIKKMLGIVRMYKNWPFVFLDHLGLIRKRTFTYVMKNGARIKARPRTDDKAIINDIWIDKVYTRYYNIKKGDIVIDIGAQIGVFSIFAGMKRAVVYAYEPFSDNYELLVENICINNLTNVKTFSEAISNTNGETTLYISEHTGRHSIKEDISDIRKIKKGLIVKTVSLDSVFQQNNIDKCDLLKLDCEGAEYDILFGASKETLRKVRNIALEYHDSSGYNHKELKSIIEGNGFLVFIDEESNLLYAINRQETKKPQDFLTQSLGT